MPRLLPTTPVALARGRRPTYAAVLRRLKRLRLTEADLVGCVTIGDIQAVAKRQWHSLASRYHPDVEGQRVRRQGVRANLYAGRPLTGYTFRLMTKTYDWLKALDARQPLATLPDCTSYVPWPEHEYEVPWSMTRAPLVWEVGYQEWWL